MTVPLPGLSEALKANHIPVEPYIRLPGIQVSPHGLAYIPLPEPCSDFCLTNYLASTSGVESDAEDMNRILSVPHVSEVLAIFVTGGSMSVEIAKTTVTKALEAQKGWCMPSRSDLDHAPVLVMRPYEIEVLMHSVQSFALSTRYVRPRLLDWSDEPHSVGICTVPLVSPKLNSE